MYSRLYKKFKILSLALMTILFMHENVRAQSRDPDTCAILGYAGVDVDDLQIPRTGLYNPLLNIFFNVTVEPSGNSVTYKGCSFVTGAASSFGGPDDKTISQKEVAALTGEPLHLLNNPQNPDPKDLATRPEKYYYAAMRIKYSDKTIKKWESARIIVVNPKTGAILALRIIDWGPGPSPSHRIIDMSPQSLHDLGLKTDEEPYIAFGLPQIPLGIVPQNLDH